AGAKAYVPAPDLSRPVAPSNLAAAAEDGAVAVDLTWDCSAGATDYEVIRTLDGGAFSFASWTGGTCSFRDAAPATQLQPGTLYHYQVIALNNVGASDFSNAADATTWSPPPSPPPAPTNLAAIPGSGAVAVDLSWDCSAGATDYRVNRMPEGGSWSTVAAS